MLEDQSIRVNKRDTHNKVKRIAAKTGYTLKYVYSFIVKYCSEKEWIKMLKNEGDI